jgi:hypothetical protein
MNDRQEKVAKVIFDLMHSLPADERPDVWSSITHNAVFCVHCGYGDLATPNPGCQCTNDE